jgi:hypothetical protein
MTTLAHILEEVRHVIARPEGWSQKAFYRDHRGEPCIADPQATITRRCMIAAIGDVVDDIKLVHPDERWDMRDRAIRALVRAIPSNWQPSELKLRGGDLRPEQRLYDFNDDECTTHADVIALINRAIVIETSLTTA